MRIARVELNGRPATGIVIGEAVRLLPQEIGVLDVLCSSPDERERLLLLSTSETELAQTRLLSPVAPVTLRDFSAFEQHLEGAVMVAGGPDAKVFKEWYEAPACYFSNPHAVTGPGDEVSAPPDCEALDLEVEVAAIVGGSARNISPQQASEYIVGYTIWNDWSARDLGAREAVMPFGFCKAKDFANTLGPWIVTADELERHRDGDRLDLEMHASVNGVKLGSDTLANMAWSFEELVAFAARGAWIAPGDVIGSGTCGSGCLMEFWGRNQAQQPPPLQSGDEVELVVEGIGTLTNAVGPRTPALPPLPRAQPGRLRHRAATA